VIVRLGPPPKFHDERDMLGLQVDPVGACRRELLESGAKHEEEEQRLDQRGDNSQPILREADQLSSPDDLDRPQLAAPAAR